MTAQRRDGHSTELGIWLRQQSEIDSSLGFLATNIDYVWMNYKTGWWMIIEEKRNWGKVQKWQQDIFDKLHKCCMSDDKFCGFHLLVFEKTSPDDGLMWWDKKPITKDELIRKLQFL